MLKLISLYFDVTYHFDCTSKSCRVHFGFTSSALEIQFDAWCYFQVTPTSLRFHFSVTSVRRRCNFDFTSSPLRVRFDFTSLSLQLRRGHFGFISTSLRANCDFTSTSLRFSASSRNRAQSICSLRLHCDACRCQVELTSSPLKLVFDVMSARLWLHVDDTPIFLRLTSDPLGLRFDFTPISLRRHRLHFDVTWVQFTWLSISFDFNFILIRHCALGHRSSRAFLGWSRSLF